MVAHLIGGGDLGSMRRGPSPHLPNMRWGANRQPVVNARCDRAK
jgi:hypothetical protein